MSEEFTFAVGPDQKVTVRSSEELQSWVEAERAQWSWLIRGDVATDGNHNIASAVQNEWDSLINELQHQRNRGQPLSDAIHQLNSFGNESRLVSTTKKGTAVLDILEAAGPAAAAFAYGFITGRLQLQHAQTPEQFTGAILTAFPNLRDDATWHTRLKQERANFKAASRRLADRVDREADERIRNNVELVKRASAMAKRLFNQKRRTWISVQSAWQEGANRAVEEIQNTDTKYKEFMNLKAPVEYWQGKAEQHKNRESLARRLLIIYFPATTLFVGFIFYKIANFLLNSPKLQDGDVPIALYVVVSGGLVILSTLAFWIGRLLTKLYLSEHHLRNDAEERAVMTTTYLALTNDGEAADADRQIVLNALFRPTPDGIVKDEGPNDASLHALIARLAVR